MKSTIIVACLGLLFAVSRLSAQPGVNWERFKTTGFENEENSISFCSALVANPDGGVTAFGTMFSPNLPRRHYPVIYRYSSRGVLMDSAVFSGDSPYYIFYSAIKNHNGQLLATGRLTIRDSTTQTGFRNPAFMMKFHEETLEVDWVQEYRTDSTQAEHYLTNIIELRDNYVAVGYKVADGGNEPWVVKTDSDGNLVWQKGFSRNRHFGENIAGEVVVLPDDRIVISATIEDIEYLIWLSSDGDSLTSIEVNETAGKCISLFVQNDTLWDVNAHSVVKYSYEGEELAVHPFKNWLPANVYGFQQAVDAIPVEGGGCVVTGFTNYELEFDPYYYRSITVRIDAQFRERWKLFRDTGGHYYEEKGMTVAQCEDYGICVGGTMGRAFWLLKTARDPNEVTNYPVFINPNQFLIEAVYPNPFNSTALISYTLPEARRVRVAIYDLEGKLVADRTGEMEAGAHRETWQADGFAAGVYFLKLTAGNEVQTAKLLLVK